MGKCQECGREGKDLELYRVIVNTLPREERDWCADCVRGIELVPEKIPSCNHLASMLTDNGVCAGCHGVLVPCKRS